MIKSANYQAATVLGCLQSKFYGLLHIGYCWCSYAQQFYEPNSNLVTVANSKPPVSSFFHMKALLGIHGLQGLTSICWLE